MPGTPSHPNKPYYYEFGGAQAGGGAGSEAVANGRKLVALVTPRGNPAGYGLDAISGIGEANHASGETGARTTSYVSALGWNALQLDIVSGATPAKHIGNSYPNAAHNIVQLLEANRSGLVINRTRFGILELEGYVALQMSLTSAASTHMGHALWGFFGAGVSSGTFTIDTWTDNNMLSAGVGFFAHPDGNWYAVIAKYPDATYPTSIFHTFQDTGVAWDGYIRHLKLHFTASAASTPVVTWYIDGTLVHTQTGTLGSFQFDNENNPLDFGKLFPTWALFISHESDTGTLWPHLGAGTRLWIEEPE